MDSRLRQKHSGTTPLRSTPRIGLTYSGALERNTRGGRTEGGGNEQLTPYHNSSIESNNAIAYSGIFTSHDSFRKSDREVRTAYFGAYLSQYARRLQDLRFSAALTSMGITFDPLWTRKSTSPVEFSVLW